MNTETYSSILNFENQLLERFKYLLIGSNFMSIFKIMERSLEQNPKVILAHSKRELWLPSIDREDKFKKMLTHQPLVFSDECKFFVAPKEPTFDENLLNDFMKSLVPFKAEDVLPFYKSDDDLTYGRLRFKENIGSISYEVEITDTDLEKEELAKRGFSKDRKMLGCASIPRIIYLHVYPSWKIAEYVGTGAEYSSRFEYCITEGAMREINKGTPLEEISLRGLI